MKLTSSPSVSSSTSTATDTAFGGIFPSSKGSVFGCLSFVLRRMLCSRSLPTHPSDQLKEIDPIENHFPHFMKSQKVDDSAMPNLVARLMGLDSMPDVNIQKSFSSITRSKSMNSVDCRFQEVEEMQGQHRRVKTSVSFRETPSYFELEDDDFFVLSFENVDKNRKPRSKKVKSNMGRRENEQRRRRRRERFQSKEIDGGMSKEQNRKPTFNISEGNSQVFVLQMEISEEAKARHRWKKKEKCLEDAKVETESESENSSPVSVLDHSLFISDHEVPTTDEERSNRSSSPRRKLVSEVLNLEKPSPDHEDETSPKGNEQDPDEATEGKQAGLQRKDYHKHQNVEMLNQICRLAEADMADLEWSCKSGIVRNLKNWKVEIGVELGLWIVDQLLDELVHQLL